ncbi:uncharacterized protein LOC117268870 [Epinephelus lanceolatus]|uniref:uncharacterized protein LOC117268870 n=1 Tax=Epinephelus lanceolatus TaxID=310571 RepID=UPI001445DFAF|nr:uncharacterized protein LOC117268870 [Epinephelus lanceolatus]
MGRDCGPRQKWDSLLSICFPSVRKTRPEPDPPSEPPLADLVQFTAKTPPPASLSRSPEADSVMLLNPALWIFVVLATVGSIVALVLWFLIYKRQTRNISISEDAERRQEPLQKTEPPAKIHLPPPERNGQAEMLLGAAWALSPCPHLHLGAQTGSKWEEGFTACRDPAKHAGTEGGRGPPACSTMREHRIPLPATELGGTALVTTKTV